MKTILAPIDFSSISDSVLAAAATLAHALDGRVVILHSVPPPVVQAVMMTEYSMEPERTTLLAQQTAAAELARRRQELEKTGVAVETIQGTGPASPEILEQAGKVAADYIVMGSHGHTALYDLFVGSTAHGVLKRAPCPVLIVPAPK